MTQPAAAPPAIVAPTPVEAARYGLFSAATVITAADDAPPEQRRWENGVQFQSDNCAQVSGWAAGCATPFTVTLTKTAVDDQFTVLYAPVGSMVYEISINGGAFAVVGAGAQIVVPLPGNVTVREQSGLQRSVSLTVDPDALLGTVFSASSGTAAPNPAKTGTDRPIYTGGPFGLYAGVACGSLGGILAAEGEATARARLASGEQRAAEKFYESGALGNRPRLADPGVNTPAGIVAVTPKKALDILEAYLGDGYGGVGTIHAPRWMAVYFADRFQIVPDGPRLRTPLGTLWAFGSGYEGLNPQTGALPPANQGWIYATGYVTVRRSGVYVPATGREVLDRTTNQALVVAERTYVITHDCLTPAAALITMAGESSVVPP